VAVELVEDNTLTGSFLEPDPVPGTALVFLPVTTGGRLPVPLSRPLPDVFEESVPAGCDPGINPAACCPEGSIFVDDSFGGHCAPLVGGEVKEPRTSTVPERAQQIPNWVWAVGGIVALWLILR
jgi:hypothetical protein